MNMGNDIILYLYLSDVVHSAGVLLVTVNVLGWVALWFSTSFSFVHHDCHHKTFSFRPFKKYLIALIILTSLTIIIPDKNFMHMLLGIKGVEMIIESEDFKSISSKTLELVNKKLDEGLKGEKEPGVDASGKANGTSKSPFAPTAVDGDSFCPDRPVGADDLTPAAIGGSSARALRFPASSSE